MPPKTSPPLLQPPQFTLRTLLLGVAGLCSWLAAACLWGVHVALLLLLGALVVLAHAAAAAIGHSLLGRSATSENRPCRFVATEIWGSRRSS